MHPSFWMRQRQRDVNLGYKNPQALYNGFAIRCRRIHEKLLTLLQLARTVRRHAGSDAKLTGAILHDVGRTYVTESSFRSSASPMWSRQHATTRSVVAARAPRAASAAAHVGKHTKATPTPSPRFCRPTTSGVRAAGVEDSKHTTGAQQADEGTAATLTWPGKTSQLARTSSPCASQRPPTSCARSETRNAYCSLPLCADTS